MTQIPNSERKDNGAGPGPRHGRAPGQRPLRVRGGIHQPRPGGSPGRVPQGRNGARSRSERALEQQCVRQPMGFSFTDPAGALDAPFVGIIDWGDGSATSPFSSSPVSSSHTYPPGSFTITVNVSDKDGDAAQQQTTTVSLQYSNSGVLPPVNTDGSSVFKFGSTIPVKIRITDCAGNPVTGLSPEIGTSMTSSLTPSQGVNETPSTSAADTTGHMRYDSTAGQYIYNFATKYLPDANAAYYFYIRDPAIGQLTQKFGVRSS